MDNYPIIFLDIDGVLNTHDYDYVAKSNKIRRRMIKKLNLILSMTGAKIVLSSAWRYLVHRGEMNITGLGWLLRSHGLKHDALLDVTGEDTCYPTGQPRYNERAYQIEKWLLDNNPNANYVIIDDNDFDFTKNNMNFHQVKTQDGLNMSDVKQIIKLLGFRINE